MKAPNANKRFSSPKSYCACKKLLLLLFFVRLFLFCEFVFGCKYFLSLFLLVSVFAGVESFCKKKKKKKNRFKMVLMNLGLCLKFLFVWIFDYLWSFVKISSFCENHSPFMIIHENLFLFMIIMRISFFTKMFFICANFFRFFICENLFFKVFFKISQRMNVIF